MSLVLPPKARYMIVCDDVVQDPRWPGKPVIVGLICRVAWPGGDGPMTLAKMTVYLVLTDGRGDGLGQVRCVNEATGQPAFQSPVHPVSFAGRDPLGLYGVVFRLTDCEFRTRAFTSSSFSSTRSSSRNASYT